MSATADFERHDPFAATFGAGRGNSDELRRTRPVSPDGHKRCVAVNMRPWEGGNWWKAGWYGSPWTISIFMDDDRQALWTRHRHGNPLRDRPLRDRPLRDDDPHARHHVPWESLPHEVRARIAREVELGVHTLAGGSNERPLSIW